jgi:Collagen triple helix repeat (20 copies)
LSSLNPDEDTRANDLLQQSLKLDEQKLGRSIDRRFYGTWLFGGLIALLAGMAIFLGNRANADNDRQAQQLAENTAALAEANQKQTDDINKYLRGEQGLPGVPGANGEDGTPGLPGSSGEPGEIGPQGPVGPTGPTGIQGPEGLPGLAGSQGLQGSGGPTGATGPQGEVGSKGDKGEKGDTGATGDKGADGATGSQGPPGPQGPPGLGAIQAAFATSASNPNDVKSANAVCPGGTTVISGGFIIQGPASINVTLETTANNGWLVNAQETAPVATDWAVQAFALCAPAQGTN